MPKKFSDEALVRAIEQFLEGPVNLPGLDLSRTYRRRHDDTDGKDEGYLVLFGDSHAHGDVWLETCEVMPTDSLRFREPYIGGGGSPRVNAALRILAWAIKLDNERLSQTMAPST